MNNAVKSGISVAIAVVTLVLAAYMTGGQALFVFVPFYSAALLVALAQVLDSRHQKRSRGQLPPRAAQ
jgi:membrane protein implicated in regulation of membrane protease activity